MKGLYKIIKFKVKDDEERKYKCNNNNEKTNDISEI